MIKSTTKTHKSGHVETVLINEHSLSPDNKERQWRDSELLRTDRLVILPDYPRGKEKQVLLTYRQQLADYPQQPDYPNGARPVMP